MLVVATINRDDGLGEDLQYSIGLATNIATCTLCAFVRYIYALSQSTLSRLQLLITNQSINQSASWLISYAGGRRYIHQKKLMSTISS